MAIRNSASWQEVEKEIVLLQNLIKRLPEEEKVGASIRICFESALWGGRTTPEMIGILELAKIELYKADDETTEFELDEGDR